MAEALIERWRLAVLRVRLDLASSSPMVTAELVGYPSTDAHTYWRAEFDYGKFGLSEGTGPPSRLDVPRDLVDGVARCLNADFSANTALWLRLIPPYGHLGAVPWEGALVPTTGRPLVRVPDRLPPGSDPGRVWTVAIAVSAAPDAPWVAGYLSSFVSSLRTSVAGGVDVHVFTERGGEQALRALLQRGSDEPQVHLHDPGEAIWFDRSGTGPQLQVYDGNAMGGSLGTGSQLEVYDGDVRRFRWSISGRASGTGPQLEVDDNLDAQPAPGRLLWGDWIAAGLAGRAVRALHIVADGAFDGNRPVLSVSSDPAVPTRRSDQAYVTADRVRRLADRVGASVLSFGSPPDNPCDSATRMMAAHVGLRRAGPTFYSALPLDPAGYALARAHAFIAAAPGSLPIPRDPSLFMYLQPEFVQAALQDPWPDPDRPGQAWLSGRAPIGDSATSGEILPNALGAAGGEQITARYADAESVPMWVAAATRYIENQVAALVRTAGVPGETPDAKQAYDLGVGQAIAELRALVDERMRES
ncbi:hypothetical protein [Embleya sp. NBC_00896]|uniref:hypothetical protein n=1 Tax=Embleya sp. NBC_00896 TaxID=2975961 RepID=UPI002F91A72E|nr:hypothetical protein OG928_42870 [Embleya sp. NBC_00896]